MNIQIVYCIMSYVFRTVFFWIIIWNLFFLKDSSNLFTTGFNLIFYSWKYCELLNCSEQFFKTKLFFKSIIKKEVKPWEEWIRGKSCKGSHQLLTRSLRVTAHTARHTHKSLFRTTILYCFSSKTQCTWSLQ